MSSPSTPPPLAPGTPPAPGTPAPAPPGLAPLSNVEFIALAALLFATVAFAIDAMLPLLGEMGRALSPDDPGRAQLVITVFVFGLGLGTFLAGPISDAFGRKPVILGGIALYMVAATVAALTSSIEMLLLARFVQGLGSAAPRVVTQALVRDLFAGRAMARVMSFTMAVFVLVPAVAPLIGAGIAALFGWRAIFWSFLVFGVVSGLWLLLRQPETLPTARRRPLSARQIGATLAEIASHGRVMLLLLALSCGFAGMFVWLASLPLLFEETYDRAAEFPLWFALIAIASVPASLLNARLVMRLGMQRLIILAMLAQFCAASVMLVLMGLGMAGFVPFMLFMLVQFSTIAMIFGNLNAMALEPLGHVAGTAASVMGGVSTMAAAVIATPIARAFDGTPTSVTLGTLGCAGVALLCILLARRERVNT
ncbi:MAG: multidrug effflux MFS transporter [Pararhodobacter sp.]|nr:multidrug effflux MFS transporter [Pararhodobacter sp.]